MARIDNLQNFLTDVAGAIKTKKSYPEETKLAPANFDTEIESISGGELQEKTLTITENQTVELLPDEGYDGMSKVTVEVNIDAVMKTADYEEAKELASDILGEPKVVYGIRRTLNSTEGGWTRTDDAVGMVAKPTYGTTIGQNDFDNAPIYKDIITQDYNISTNTVEAELR